ncbi:MAG: hypothetical protein Q9209_004589 [Squamulea sp. 1 TL-2023]
MAPQGDIPISANVLGTIGTVFWCIQLIPQVWYNWKQKKTDGLPGLMMFIWAVSAVPFGVYAIVQKFNIPIQIQPQAFCLLALTSWAQLLASMDSIIACGRNRCLFRKPPGPSRPDATNFVFLSIDWLGAFFSLMALVAQHTFDVLGGVQYIVCLLLEAGIFTSHLLFLLRSRSLRRRAKESNIPFDEMPEARKFVFPRPESTTASAQDRNHELSDVEKGGVGSTGEEMEAKKSFDTIGNVEGGRRRGSTVGSTAGAGRWPNRQRWPFFRKFKVEEINKGGYLGLSYI